MNQLSPALTDFQAHRTTVLPHHDIGKVLSHVQTHDQPFLDPDYQPTLPQHAYLQNLDDLATDYSQLVYLGEPGCLTNQLISGHQPNQSLLNAIAVCCSHKELLDGLFFRYDSSYSLLQGYHQDKDLFVVRLYKNRKQKYSIIIDKQLAVLKLASHQEVPCLSRSDSMDVATGMLLEKAYSKLMAHQKPAVPPPLPTILRDMTGLDPEIFNIGTCRDAALFYQWIKFCHDMGYFIGLMGQEDKIVSVDSIDDLNGTLYVNISSPWKNLQVPARQNISQVQKQFDRLIVLRDFPSYFSGVQVDIEHRVLSTQQQQQPWQYNQQLIVQLERPGRLIFRVFPTELVSHMESYQIGFFLFKLGPQEDKITTLNYKQLLHNAKATSSFPLLATCRSLEKGKYAAILYATNKTHTQHLTLEVYSDLKSTQLKYFNKYAQPITNLTPILEVDLAKTPYRQRTIPSKRELISPELLQQHRLFFDPYLQQKTLQFDDLFIPHAVDFFAPATKQKQKEETIEEDALLETFQNEKLLDQFQQEGKPIEENGIYDFNDFGLTDIGLEALTPVILQKGSIESMLLSNNALTSPPVIHLLSMLDQGHHYELTRLDLSQNTLDQSVVDQLVHMAPRFPKLVWLSLQQHPPLNLKALKTALRKTKIE